MLFVWFTTMYFVLCSALAQNANVLEQHYQPHSRDTQPAMNALIHSLFSKPEGIAMLICSDLEHSVGTGVFIALFTAPCSVYKQAGTREGSLSQCRFDSHYKFNSFIKVLPSVTGRADLPCQFQSTWAENHPHTALVQLWTVQHKQK